jgi:hypothetical protein
MYNIDIGLMNYALYVFFYLEATPIVSALFSGMKVS